MKRSGLGVFLICLAISLGIGFFVAKDLEGSLHVTSTLQYWGAITFIWLIGCCVAFLVFAALLFVIPAPKVQQTIN
ncbi:hypothetical protein K2Q00_01155 [Patescibacteria group bacterium]|nr:hypothetical protein [Patescibacteria group bacterium]